MLKRPFEYLTSFYKEKIERDRKTVEYIHTQVDSLITWVIGFSFTGLLLLISNLNSLKGKSPTKPIVICLFICIVLGIFFRYVSYLMTIFQKALDNYYYGLFSDEMRPIMLDEEIDNMSFDQLLRLLKRDFDEDINYPFPLTGEFKKAEEPNLRKRYLDWIEQSKKEFDNPC